MALDSGFFDAIQGVINLLNMLGGFVRRTLRGNRTTVFREWRSRDNTWLGLATLIAIAVVVFVVWALIVI